MIQVEWRVGEGEGPWPLSSVQAKSQPNGLIDMGRRFVNRSQRAEQPANLPPVASLPLGASVFSIVGSLEGHDLTGCGALSTIMLCLNISNG